MKHPNQATLALHAGGDLGPWTRWRTERHVARCERCRDEIAAFDQLHEALPGLAEIPEIPWNRLATEMQANIRLGLAAGACVRTAEPVRTPGFFDGARMAVALAGVLVLLVTGILLERPHPLAVSQAGIVVQTTPDGIQVGDGNQAMGLLHSSAQKDSVTYQVGAQGSMEARYVDSKTGYVTVNKVNVD